MPAPISTNILARSRPNVIGGGYNQTLMLFIRGTAVWSTSINAYASFCKVGTSNVVELLYDKLLLMLMLRFVR